MLIAITGEHALSPHAPSLAAMGGFDYFLTKPADHDELLSLIEKASKQLRSLVPG
jgi:hypothetical protein